MDESDKSQNKETNFRWNLLPPTQGVIPKARHGHRCISIGKNILIFGGGGDSMMSEVHVFNTTNKRWYTPKIIGFVPPSCAAFGFICYKYRVIVHGGMQDNGQYTSEMYELDAKEWKWKPLPNEPSDEKSNIPCARLGHSLVLGSGTLAYLFGGITPKSTTTEASYESQPNSLYNYLNDFFILDISNEQVARWSKPKTYGSPPRPRESHSCVLHTFPGSTSQRLFVYGGMCGQRLGDLYMLDIDSFTWSEILPSGLAPEPRSLHSACASGNRMIVFGGWIPKNSVNNGSVTPQLTRKNKSGESTSIHQTSGAQWLCTNSCYAFDVITLTWSLISPHKIVLPSEKASSFVPPPRAGHCSVMVSDRMYIWSGRDEYHKSFNKQLFFGDMWYLETTLPPPPKNIYLELARPKGLTIRWEPVYNATHYIVQIFLVGRNDLYCAPTITIPTPPSSTSSQFHPASTSSAISHPIHNNKALSASPSSSKDSQMPKDSSDPNSSKVSTIKTTQPCPPLISAFSTSLTPIRPLSPNSVHIDALPSFNIATVHPTNNTLGSRPQSPSKIPILVSPVKTECVPIANSPMKVLEQASSISNSGLATLANVTLAAGKSLDSSKTVTTAPSTALKIPMMTIDKRFSPLSRPTSNFQTKYAQYSQRWYDACILPDVRINITHFFSESQTRFYMASASHCSRASGRNCVSLEPAHTYKIRIASVNSLGVGVFSNSITCCTSTPNLPIPPGDVKVKKQSNGTFVVKWEPVSGNIISYQLHAGISLVSDESVTLITTVSPVIETDSKGLSTITDPHQSFPTVPGNETFGYKECSVTENTSPRFAYKMLYYGTQTAFSISPENAKKLYVDRTGGKPHVHIRICAQNTFGYGQCTHARWFLDSDFFTS